MLRVASRVRRLWVSPTAQVIAASVILIATSSHNASSQPIQLTTEAIERAVSNRTLGAHLRAMLLNREADPGLAAAAQGIRLESSAGTTSNLVPVMIRGGVDRAELEAVGAIVGTQVAEVTSAYVPLEAIPAMLKVSGIEELESAARLKPLLDVSAHEIEVDEVWEGNPPSYSGFTGDNVVLGVIDSGIDLTHPDFQHNNGQTRILYLWDQTEQVSTPPSGYNYGGEFSSSQINSGVPSHDDTDGHGTHITGVAAGNGRATGNGYPNYRYVGIAPEADLIIVKSALTLEGNILDGVNYIFQKAQSLGKDAVVLLAVGTHKGPHDGSSSLATGISALTGSGKLVVAAAGNDGDIDLHARSTLANNQTVSVYFEIPTYSPSALWEFIDIEFWHESNAAFRVRLTSPNGISSSYIYPGNESGVVTTADGAYTISNGIKSSSSGAKVVRFFLYSKDGNYLEPGQWRVDVRRESGTQNGTFDAWIADYRVGSIYQPQFKSYIDDTRKVLNPATGDNVISVGAYTTKNQWTNGLGGTSSYVGFPPVNDIAVFSSSGPRRDGVQRPDICAPGQGVAAALSIEASVGRTNQVEDEVHWMMRGTSVAAAHTAGALAVLLEENRDMSVSQARTELRQRARSDSYTSSTPNPVWGHGKLNVTEAGAVSVAEGPNSRFQFAQPFPNPSQDETVSFQFSLSSSDVAAIGGEPVYVRIVDLRGRVVATVRGAADVGVQRLTWDGMGSDGLESAPGVYWAQLHIGENEEAVRKFVRLP